jgi:fructose-bisphosphate aldolase, class I
MFHGLEKFMVPFVALETELWEITLNTLSGDRVMTPRVREILSWYWADNPGVLANLARMLNHGRLAGTGKMVILPVDQGFEHGPARSFAINPNAYDPHYHFGLAIESGCNAYAAPLGSLEAGAREFAGEVPLILKVNNSDSLMNSKGAPISAMTSSVEDALRLGCAGIGFTIYPGSTERKKMYEEIRTAASEAKKAGLAVVIWSYPRGEGLSKDGETAIDVVAYAAQVAAQLGAHIIKVKPPTSHIEQPEAKKVFEAQGIKVAKLEDRTRHVIESSFNGKRIVIFSGGASKSEQEVLDEVKGLAQGGSFGSIMGRNAFQRPKEEAIKLLHSVMDIYKG